MALLFKVIKVLDKFLVLRIWLWFNVKRQRYSNFKRVQTQFLVIITHIHKQSFFVGQVEIILQSIVDKLWGLNWLKILYQVGLFPLGPNEVDTLCWVILLAVVVLFWLVPPGSALDYLPHTSWIIANLNVKFKEWTTLLWLAISVLLV